MNIEPAWHSPDEPHSAVVCVILSLYRCSHLPRILHNILVVRFVRDGGWQVSSPVFLPFKNEGNLSSTEQSRCISVSPVLRKRL